MCKVYLEQDYLDSMYILLRMPFKVYPVPCFIKSLPECTLMIFFAWPPSGSLVLKKAWSASAEPPLIDFFLDQTYTIYSYTRPEKKHMFNIHMFHGDSGPGSVTSSHVHHGKCSSE